MDDETESLESDNDGTQTEPPRLIRGKQAARLVNQADSSKSCNVNGSTSSLLQDTPRPDGQLKDITVLDIDDPPKVRRAEQRSRDVDQFFDESHVRESDGKKCRKCKLCPRPTLLVAEVSTLRRHLESNHRAEYMKWAKVNDFASMLPKDRKSQKDESRTSHQTQLDPHLQPSAPKAKTIPYTDDQFREAAIQWLVETDQPLSALQHPAFKNMINLAACATNGVRLPSRKVTQQTIIDTFRASPK